MKIFVSSVISGFEAFREAAARAAITLGHEVLRAEDFGASPTTPQQTCLAAVRDADLVLSLFGARYGEPQPSGLSATHEEFVEAQERRALLAFVQTGIDPEPRQAEFVREAQAWESGAYTSSFDTPESLEREAIRRIKDYEVSLAAAPLDIDALLTAAKSMAPRDRSDSRPKLFVGVALGPRQQVLRPAELDAQTLGRELQQRAMFGQMALLDSGAATDVTVEGNWLSVTQESSNLRVGSSGDIAVVTSARRDDANPGIPDIIVEEIQQSIEAVLAFAAATLDELDPVKRLTHAAIVVKLVDANYTTWRTRAERDASPNSAAIGSGRDSELISLDPAVVPRASLDQQRQRIAEDLTVLLGRERQHRRF